MDGFMRGGTVLILLGLTALGAYTVGHQGTPTGKASVAASRSPAQYSKPVAYVGSTAQALAASPSATLPPSPAPAPAANPSRPITAERSENKRKVEVALTAAAIAAIIVAASRDQYHATGRPCACPDDSARNGSACGGRSAYSRPGGAAPLCYPGDVITPRSKRWKKFSLQMTSGFPTHCL